jgi:hypothetical protein
LHKLRHYSATELILAGVDVRTVGGRLGHAGGGTTTLRVYAAFVSEADQRASRALSGRMPERPAVRDQRDRAKDDPAGALRACSGRNPPAHLNGGLGARSLCA